MVAWMNRYPLAVLIVVSFVVLATGDLGMSYWSHRLPYRRKLAEIATARDVNLLFVGNSLLDGYIDGSKLEQAADPYGVRFRALNAALGATLPPEQELLFDYAIQRQPAVRTVVIGFFDLQLTAEVPSRVGDLTGNRMVAMDGSIPMSEVEATYGFDWSQRLAVEMMRELPLAANRASAWRDVELLRRRMAQVGMPPVATNSMGRVADFQALEVGSEETFDAEIEEYLRGEQRFNSPYRVILRECRERGLRVVILIMPASPYHRNRYYAHEPWKAYVAAVRALAAEQNIALIDASDWMPEDQDFVDHLHLAPNVVGEFSSRLGVALAVLQKP